MDLPTFSDAQESLEAAAGTIQEHGRTLIPWLPNPPTCNGCGALMYADVAWDPEMVEYTNSWTCRAEDCSAPDRYRTDSDTPDPEPPREGSSRLREVFNDTL